MAPKPSHGARVIYSFVVPVLYNLRVSKAVKMIPPSSKRKVPNPTAKTDVSDIQRLRAATWKKIPVPRIEGTQSPTKAPASLLVCMPMPNQRETEKRKDRKAARRINKSPLPSIKSTPNGTHTIRGFFVQVRRSKILPNLSVKLS